MANNNIDPQIMAQLMQMYQQGQINIQNPNMNMNPFGNNNQTVFIPPNSNQFNANNNMFGMGMNNMNFVNNMNNVNNQNQNQGEDWLITFEKKPENSKINIQISSSEIVANIFLKYREKSMLNIPLKFTYKGKPLDGKLPLSASGLSNNATITVEKGESNTVLKQNLVQNNPNQFNLFFEKRGEDQTINIQVQPDKLVKDAILAYKNKIQKDTEMIFIFNSKTLHEDMSLKEAGISSGARIMVVEIGQIKGAYYN